MNMSLSFLFAINFEFFVDRMRCAYLHRPDDAQLARTSLTTFKDVKLEDSIKNESIAASEILNSEITAIRYHSRARRG